MVKDIEKFQAEDQEHRKKVDAHNALELYASGGILVTSNGYLIFEGISTRTE